MKLSPLETTLRAEKYRTLVYNAIIESKNITELMQATRLQRYIVETAVFWLMQHRHIKRKRFVTQNGASSWLYYRTEYMFIPQTKEQIKAKFDNGFGRDKPKIVGVKTDDCKPYETRINATTRIISLLDHPIASPKESERPKKQKISIGSSFSIPGW